MALNPTKTASNPRIAKLIELEVAGRIKPEHKQELETYRAQGLAPPAAGGDLTENQSKNTGFYARAAEADRNYLKTEASREPLGVLEAGVTAVLPDAITNSFISDDRQLSNQARKNFILASLRAESGAAIGPNEYRNQEITFFPQPGDSDAVIAQKARDRQVAINALRVSAGEGASQVKVNAPSATAQAQQDAKDGLTRVADGTALDADGRLVIDVEGGQLPADQQAEIKARTKDSDGFGAAAMGLADTITFGALDEIGSAAEAAFGSGSGSFADRYNARLAVNRGIRDAIKKESGGSYLTGQLAGGLALPTFGAAGVGQLARLGAGYGAAYGFGSNDGDLGQRALGAGIGGAAGGAGAAALAGLGGAVASRFGGGPGGGGGGAGREVLEAAGRLNEGRAVADQINVLPADVGGPMTRRFTAGAVQTPFGSGPIIRAADQAQTNAGGRLAEIAASEGGALRQEALGEVGQRASQGYIDRTGAASREAYAAARGMAGDTRIRAQGAVANIDSQLAELAPTANTDAGLITGLQRLRADLANEGDLSALSIDSIRRLRTSTRAEARSEGLRATDYQRRAGQVLDSLSDDIASQLEPRAAAAFREADRAYAERLSTIDDVMEEIVGSAGDRSAEAVARRLSGLARGDSARLGRFLNAVTPEEAGIVRGSLINEIGRANPGAQNAAGDAFSFSTFLSNWDKLPERSRNLLFRGEHRQAVEDLARLAEGARATRSYANTSGTGGAMNSSRFVSEAGRMASTAGGITTLGLTPILENLTGRLLASRRFTQFLARPPRDRSAAIRRLSAIASREPAIANDLVPIRNALQQSVTSAAASPAGDSKRQVQNGR
jgi:hypothetical protein